MTHKIEYEFSAKVWRYETSGGWYFISLPEELGAEIRENLKWQEEGWGRLKAVAEIGKHKWETAIWFDTKKKTYLLPIKAEVRKKEKIEIDKMIAVSIWL